jgi:signal peptidase I
VQVPTYEPAPHRSVRPADLYPDERDAVRAADPPTAAAGRRHHDLPVLVVMALVLAFLIKTFLVQAFFIPSGSMIPTLQVGDRVLVEKVTFRVREPARGDVIVFRRPGAEARRGLGAGVRSFFEGLGLAQPDEDIDLIKRIVALPGDTVEIVGGVVHIDGQPLDEPYLLADQRDFPSLTIPDGHYYMLGDNRGNSDDSRYSLGTVPRDHVVGRAFVILWPPTRLNLGLGHTYSPVESRAPPAD